MYIFKIYLKAQVISTYIYAFVIYIPVTCLLQWTFKEESKHEVATLSFCPASLFLD
jgi:hypothetical protein